jgi:tetratricopeptide (TPR) repeat protein
MPNWRTLSIACAAFVLLAPASLVAQAKDGFVRGVVDFINAADGPPAARAAAVDTMVDGLAQWDALLARVEAGMAAEIGGVPPPTAARMRTALGAAYLERGKLEAGLAQLDAAAALDGSSPDVHLFRGLALESAGRPAEAAAAYHRAWQRDTASATNAYRFLRAYRQASGPPGVAAPEVAAATRTLRTAVEAASTAASSTAAPPFTLLTLDLLDDGSSAAPVIPPAAYANAFAILRRGRYDDAVAGFRQTVDAGAPATAAAERAVADERGRLAAADARVAAGDQAAARQTLIDAAGAPPRSLQASWRLGTLLQSLGDQRGAVEALEAAASGPVVGAAPLWATVGRLHHLLLDLDAAAAAYGRRVALQPNDSEGHCDLADVYRARDDLAAATVEALTAALLDPKNARAYAMVGQLDAAAGRDNDALPMLRKAVELAPADGEARYALSRALLRLGRRDEAQRELEVFQQLQSRAMEAERRRFEENQATIDKALKAEEGKAPGR